MKIQYQNLSDAAKAVLREKSIALGSYIRKEEELKPRDLSYHLQKPEDELQNAGKEIKDKSKKQ